jgi:fatty-acyl-CoA synthase
VPRESVYTNLARCAERHPDRTAIHYYGTEISYGELKRDADALAGWLQQRCGVRKGDRVLLYLQNSPQFVVAYYAVLRADAVVVPINPMNLADELRHYIEDAGTAVAIAGQELEERVTAQPALRHVVYASYSDYVRSPTDLPLPDFVRAPARSRSWKDALAAGLAPGPHQAQPEDLAVMPYTSGTTGKPKGCMHTHSSVQATTVAYLQWRGSGDGAVVLTPLPMFHVTGMQAGMNGPLCKGATLVVMSRWDRDCAARLIERRRVTNWSAITTMLVDFLSNPDLDKYDLLVVAGAGRRRRGHAEALARKLEEVFGLPYVEGYGLSETMAPTHINPPQRPKRQCGGIPIFNTDARVIDIEKAPN